MYQYGSFEEKGYRFECYAPDDGADSVEFELRLLVGETAVASFSVPMVYRPVYGVDIGDVHTLEFVTDAIIQILPEPSAFDEGTKEQLLEIVRRHHGGLWCDHRLETPPNSMGSTIASKETDVRTGIKPLFASGEDAKAWLSTAWAELGGLTAEQALRRGMVEEVFELAKKLVERGTGNPDVGEKP